MHHGSLLEHIVSLHDAHNVLVVESAAFHSSQAGKSHFFDHDVKRDADILTEPANALDEKLSLYELYPHVWVHEELVDEPASH